MNRKVLFMRIIEGVGWSQVRIRREMGDSIISEVNNRYNELWEFDGQMGTNDYVVSI